MNTPKLADFVFTTQFNALHWHHTTLKNPLVVPKLFFLDSKCFHIASTGAPRKTSHSAVPEVFL